MVAPPVGLIDFLSPLTSAGFVFPGFGWFGLFLVVLLPGSLLAFPPQRNAIVCAIAFVSLVANIVSADQTLAGWQAVDTAFGDVSQPSRDYQVAQFIQERAFASSAKVLIFPEFVIPRWSEATEGFWKRTLTQAYARGQRLAIGAGVPRNVPATRLDQYQEFGPSIAALTNTEPKPSSLSAHWSWSEPFDNTLLVLGKDTTIYKQRIPVPLGMWRPWSSFSVLLRLTGAGTINIAGQRAAILICYEQLVPWPVLLSMLERPTVLVGISNTFWFNSTVIPHYQHTLIHIWGRLFGIPVLTAVNS